jgi:N-acetylglucosamine-6-phosphate deacetylase
MTATAIYASVILTPHEELRDCVILVEDGKITGLGPRDEVRVPAEAVHYAAGDKIVVPGFVDIHIHGAGGHDVMEANARALDRVTVAVARYGTTSILATTVTAPVEETCHSLQGIARYIRHHEAPEVGSRPAAEILGIHLEGPFISKARRGVHPPDAITRPSAETLAQFREAADGLIKIVTVAPELPGALELIASAVAEGLVLAVGHTDADYDQTRAAFKAGARHAVHFYNAMRPFTHRDPGVIGAVLTEPEMTAEVIADGVHVAGPAIQVLIGSKGFHTVLLASDGTSATGMPDGNYRLGTMEVTVKAGVCRNSEGKLAGSTLTLDRALRYLVELGVPFIEAVRMATVLPARRIGVAGKKGIIAIGGDADLVVLTQDLQVDAVMTRGNGLT